MCEKKLLTAPSHVFPDRAVSHHNNKEFDSYNRAIAAANKLTNPPAAELDICFAAALPLCVVAGELVVDAGPVEVLDAEPSTPPEGVVLVMSAVEVDVTTNADEVPLLLRVNVMTVSDLLTEAEVDVASDELDVDDSEADEEEDAPEEALPEVADDEELEPAAELEDEDAEEEDDEDLEGASLQLKSYNGLEPKLVPTSPNAGWVGSVFSSTSVYHQTFVFPKRVLHPTSSQYVLAFVVLASALPLCLPATGHPVSVTQTGLPAAAPTVASYAFWNSSFPLLIAFGSVVWK